MFRLHPTHLFVDPAPASEESPGPFGRHVNIRYAAALRDMARLNQPNVIVHWQANASIYGPTQTEPSPQESLPMQRLIQSSLRNSLYFNLCSLLRSICFVCFLQEGGFVPWSYSRRRRRGRFADNRSPPTSRWASCGDHGSRLTRPTTLAGTKVASDPRQRLPKRKGTPLGLFFEPESAGAIALRFIRRDSLWRRDWTAIELAGRRCSTLPRESTCAKK